MMNSLLITGASGKIASALIESLQFKDQEIIAVSRHSKDRTSSKENVRYLSYAGALNQLAAREIDTLIVSGGITANKEMDSNPIESLHTNLQCSIDLINNLDKVGVNFRKVIHLGSVTQYGMKVNEIATEENCSSPITYYDQSKVLIENLLSQLVYSGIIGQSWNLRLSNIYGFTKNNNPQRGFFDSCIAELSKGNTVNIFGNGRFLRDYLYIDDLLDLLNLIHRNPSREKVQPLNIASGQAIFISDALREIVLVLKEEFGLVGKIKYVPFPTESYEIDQRNFAISVKKAEEELGWRSTVTLKVGIRKTLFKLLSN